MVALASKVIDSLTTVSSNRVISSLFDNRLILSTAADCIDLICLGAKLSTKMLRLTNDANHTYGVDRRLRK